MFEIWERKYLLMSFVCVGAGTCWDLLEQYRVSHRSHRFCSVGAQFARCSLMLTSSYLELEMSGAPSLFVAKEYKGWKHEKHIYCEILVYLWYQAWVRRKLGSSARDRGFSSETQTAEERRDGSLQLRAQVLGKISRNKPTLHLPLRKLGVRIIYETNNLKKPIKIWDGGWDFFLN